MSPDELQPLTDIGSWPSAFATCWQPPRRAASATRGWRPPPSGRHRKAALRPRQASASSRGTAGRVGGRPVGEPAAGEEAKRSSPAVQPLSSRHHAAGLHPPGRLLRTLALFSSGSAGQPAKRTTVDPKRHAPSASSPLRASGTTPLGRRRLLDPDSVVLTAAFDAGSALARQSGSRPWINTVDYSVPIYTVAGGSAHRPRSS